MAFGAQDVKILREKTGCGMMDCKRALEATNGDMEKAGEWLREKGLAASAKKASRIAAEGLVECYTDGKVTVVLEVNSETDFVAKNDTFKTFVRNCAETVAKNNPATVEDLLKLNMANESVTVEDSLKDKIFVIGENIKIRRFYRTENKAVTYVHGGGKIGALAEFNVSGDVDENAFYAMGKDVCMQIASMNPTFLSKEQVSEEILDKERKILFAQIKNDEKMASKPDAIIQKMVDGRLSKFYTQNCLLEQEFIKDNSVTVGKYVEDFANKMNVKIEVINYVRYEKGEGLEKREDNFADEVMSMMK